MVAAEQAAPELPMLAAMASAAMMNLVFMVASGAHCVLHLRFIVRI